MISARLSTGMLASFMALSAFSCKSRYLTGDDLEDPFYPVTIDSIEIWDVVDTNKAKSMVDSTKAHPHRGLDNTESFRWWYSGKKDGYCFFVRTRLGSTKRIPVRNMTPIDESWIAMRVKEEVCELPPQHADMAFGNYVPIPVFNFTDEKGITSYQWDRMFGFDYAHYKSNALLSEEFQRIAALGLDYRNLGFVVAYDRIELPGVGLVYDRKLLFRSDRGGQAFWRPFVLFGIHDNGDKFYFRQIQGMEAVGTEAVYKVPNTDPHAYPFEYKTSIREYLDAVWLQHVRARQRECDPPGARHAQVDET
jgi:hypothetical protein